MKKYGLLAPVFFAIFMRCGIFADDARALENPPKRIVALAPSMTEALYLLGAEDLLVGNTTYCVTPDAARHKEKVGSVRSPDLEKIVSLKPDLVLATALTNPKTIEKLKSLGVEVMVLPAPKDFRHLCDQFLELGRKVGGEGRAREVVASAEENVAAIRRRIAGLPKPKVFIEIGARPLVTANRGYFINDFVKLAGGTNIAEDSKIGAYSREEVLRRNADVIIIVTMGIAGEKEREAWRKFRTLNAVKYNRIYSVDSRKVCSPTPATFAETLKEIAGLLHPEISEKNL
jgi:iron complex transport system substrate-binding protein